MANATSTIATPRWVIIVGISFHVLLVLGIVLAHATGVHHQLHASTSAGHPYAESHR